MSNLERLKELTARLKHGNHDQSTHGRGGKRGGGGGKRGGGGAASAPASNSDKPAKPAGMSEATWQAIQANNAMLAGDDRRMSELLTQSQRRADIDAAFENNRISNNRAAMRGALRDAETLGELKNDVGQGASRAAIIMQRHLSDGDARAAYQQITSEYRKLENKRDRAQQAGKRDVADKYQRQGSGMLLVRDSMAEQISPDERRLIEN